MAQKKRTLDVTPSTLNPAWRQSLAGFGMRLLMSEDLGKENAEVNRDARAYAKKHNIPVPTGIHITDVYFFYAARNVTFSIREGAAVVERAPIIGAIPNCRYRMEKAGERIDIEKGKACDIYAVIADCEGFRSRVVGYVEFCYEIIIF